MSQSDVAGIVRRWIAEQAEHSPVWATGLGLPDHDDVLGDFSAAGWELRERADDRWWTELHAFGDGSGLALEDRIDLGLLRSTLAGRRVMRPWQAWRREPGSYLGACLSGVFLLFAHRSYPPAELVRCAAARLREVPDVLALAKDNLDPDLCSPLIVERSAGQCRAGVAYARDLVPGEVDDDGLRSTLAEAGLVAAAAYEDFASYLADLADRAHGSWAIGEDLYSALLIDKEQLGYGAAELRTRGQAAWDGLDAEMSDLAARIDGGRDWRATMSALNADHPGTPEEMRRGYEDWTAQSRQFLIDHDLVTLPDGESCLVEPAPAFQRPILGVASYLAPAAFGSSHTGRFFVPWPPDGASPERITQLLETNSWWSIPTITAHETYPGHHWHLSWMQSKAGPLRQAARTPYFVEGWALYAEQLMREHGFFSDRRHELCHLDARIFRAARIVVDTSLHLGDMTVEEAIVHMSTHASLSETTARAEVGRYCATPTQASSYLTGCLEIERIRAAYLAAGRGDVKRFNDELAATGGLPIGLAELALLSDR